MLPDTLLFTLLIFLPGLTLCAGAIRLRVRSILKLGLILLTGIAIPGYLLFGVYLASARIGYVISELLPFLDAGLLSWLIWRMSGKERRLMLRLLIPVGLTFFAALGVLSLGYLFGGESDPAESARIRFSHPLPPDNELPLKFAEGLRHGSVPHPLMGDWLSSDRPPLQTDFILALEPVVRSRQAEYQIAAVILQSLWIIAIWLMLRAFRISALSSALVLLTIYFSGFVVVNSFFVWPKLLAATYFVAFAIPVFVLRGPSKPAKWWLRALWAFLLACSLLSHGGSMFALLGLLLFMVFGRRWLLRQGIVTGLLALAFYAPWVGYQKFVDPPGDRLLKYHLAGVQEPTNQSLLATIYAAYRPLTPHDWLASKEADLLVLFAHDGEFLRTLAFSPEALMQIRVEQFFYLTPAIGFVGVGAFGVLLQRKHREVRAARACLICAVCILIPTVLLMFETAVTVVHAMSYAMVLLAMNACVLGLRAAVPRIATAICLMQCIWTWLVYEPDLSGTGTGLNWGMLALHVGSIVGFIAILVQASRRKRWRRFGNATDQG